MKIYSMSTAKLILILGLLIVALCAIFITYASPSQERVSQKTARAPINVIDLAGRSIVLAKPAQRIILGESRYLFALSILDTHNPIERVVGMLADLKVVDYGSYEQLQHKFPLIDDIPLVGHTSADSFSIEKTLTLNADLAIFGVEGHGPSSRHSTLINQLQQAGVTVAFVDFRHDPLVNTVKSIALLGKLLGKESRATEFISFYQQQMQRVIQPLAELMANQAQAKSKAKPNVFLHSRVGLQGLCCETVVKGMMADFVERAGGVNVASSMIPGSAGVLNFEYLLSFQPDIYIATAIGSTEPYSDGSQRPHYIALGAGIDETFAQQSFRHALDTMGMNHLTAVQQNKAYAIWHHFYNTPLNVVAVQVFAKWLYPEQFMDLAPRQTLETLFEQFQSVPLNGVYWTTLSPQDRQK
ncbi:MAG: iron complex transport system substrate-binding protein [Paraglaciecola sp.]|jgi:iron complex transport system substrate-binding protein